jgi:hypothetical protein
MTSLQGVHVEVTNIMLAWYMLIRVYEECVSDLTIAACADVDHVVQVAFNMIMYIATELHVRIARLFGRGMLWHATFTPTTRKRSSHCGVWSKYSTEAASQGRLNRFSRGRA